MDFNSYVIMSPSLRSRINSAKNLAGEWQPQAQLGDGSWLEKLPPLLSSPAPASPDASRGSGTRRRGGHEKY